jgi:sugar phosphate isomerase/epimerase
MRIGIDSYSYHRLLGEIRPGEREVSECIFGLSEMLAEMIAAGAEVVSLETVFLGAPDRLDLGVLRNDGRACDLVLAWGHPLGLHWGARPEMLADLLTWIGVARNVGASLVRCVAAGPALAHIPRDRRFADTVNVLRVAVTEAEAAGVALALENHADVDGAELAALLDAVPGLLVCLDTANALRVGDDPVALARSVADRVAMVHLKDVAQPSPHDGLVGPVSVPYGEGVIDLDGVLAALDPIGDRAVCVELGHLGGGMVDERAWVRDGVSWLRHWRSEEPRTSPR